MRTIKLLSVTSLVLLILAGPASYLATSWIGSDSYNQKMFVVAWIFSSLGIIGSACGVGSITNSDKFGTKAVIEELFGDIFGTLMLIALVCFVICGGFIMGMAEAKLATWCTFNVAFAAGVTVSFFVQLFVVVDETWTGEVSRASVSEIRRTS